MKSLLFIIVISLITFHANAESGKKEYAKSFEKEGLTEVMISNQYGTIDVKQTYGTTVEISAEIAITAKTMQKADELLDFIEITDNNENGFLNIKTTIGKDISFSRMFKGVDLSINYILSVPRGIKLRLINTNGNVFLENFEGELNVDIRSSNFKAVELTGDFSIKQVGGEFRVENIDRMTGDFRSSIVKIEDGHDLNLSLYNGECAVKMADKLNVKSSGGAAKFGEIEQMSGVASGTKFEVSDIGDLLKMEMTRGELNVRNIHFTFSNVEIKANYAKLGLTFMERAGYNLELKHNKSAKLDIPHQFNLTEQPTSESSVTVKTGFVGDKRYNSKVFLDVKYGNMYIQ